jgi:hypothetical protein
MGRSKQHYRREQRNALRPVHPDQNSFYEQVSGQFGEPEDHASLETAGRPSKNEFIGIPFWTKYLRTSWWF